MRFAFTPESLAIRDSVRALLARECTPARVREAWSRPDGRVPGLWEQLAALGVAGTLAPEEHGGLGLTELELVLVLEESGRFAAPEPIVDTAAVAVPLLRDAEARELLQAVTGGGKTVAMGLAGAPFLASADTADIVLLEHAGQVHAPPRRAVHLEPRPSIDGSRRLFQVRWEPSRDTCLVDGEGATKLLQAARDRGAVATAAQLIGLARAMLATTVDYVKARHQFGKPVGSFQAVKHHLADALIAIEIAAPAVYRAAYSLARGDVDVSTHASMAKAMASEAAELVAREALQCHGAIGYAFENDLHLWMKRAWALSVSWGDAASHRARVGRALFEASQQSGGM
ncbi:MAG: acyl-CoA dehydrogenase family protein [Polyangiaceae bacterium]